MKTHTRLFISIKNEQVRNYLSANYAGACFYVPKGGRLNTRKTRTEAIQALRKIGFTDDDICKHLKIFPSTLKHLDSKAKIGQKKHYVKKNMEYWNNYKGNNPKFPKKWKDSIVKDTYDTKETKENDKCSPNDTTLI